MELISSNSDLTQWKMCIRDRAGIAYATDQIIDLLANGVKGIHLYTMNKPDVAQKIVANLSEILA